MAIQYVKVGEKVKPLKEIQLGTVIPEAEKKSVVSVAPLPSFTGRRETVSCRVRPDVIEALKGMGDYSKHVEQALVEYAQRNGAL